MGSVANKGANAGVSLHGLCVVTRAANGGHMDYRSHGLQVPFTWATGCQSCGTCLKSCSGPTAEEYEAPGTVEGTVATFTLSRELAKESGYFSTPKASVETGSWTHGRHELFLFNFFATCDCNELRSREN